CRLAPGRCPGDGGGDRPLEGGCLALQAFELARQLLEVAPVEAGADAADVAQLSLLVDGEQQRRERPVFLVGNGVGDDDELLLARAFDLQPVAAATGALRTVGALRDDALAAV